MKESDIDIACVAVGGIEVADVPELLKAGVQGVAVSGAIANAGDALETTRSFLAFANPEA